MYKNERVHKMRLQIIEKGTGNIKGRFENLISIDSAGSFEDNEIALNLWQETNSNDWYLTTIYVNVLTEWFDIY